MNGKTPIRNIESVKTLQIDTNEQGDLKDVLRRMDTLTGVKTLHNSAKLAIQGKAENRGDFARNLKEQADREYRKREKKRR